MKARVAKRIISHTPIDRLFRYNHNQLRTAFRIYYRHGDTAKRDEVQSVILLISKQIN